MKHIFGTVLATLGAATLSAATLTVTSTLDDDSAGTLRSVLASASDGDIIVFDDSLQGQTIKIVHRTHADWAIPISASVSIVGPEDKSITLDGGFNGDQDSGSRIFAVNNPSASLSCKNLVFQNANGRDWGSQIAYGGAIYSEGDVFLDSCSFVSNRVGAIKISGRKSVTGGAAAHVLGDLTVTNCEFIGNMAPSGPIMGCVLIPLGDNFVIKNSNFIENKSSSYCAGICISPEVSNVLIEDCNFIGNIAGGYSCRGGAIYVLRNTAAKILINRCIFRNNGFKGTGTLGGSIYMDSGTNKFVIANSEFSGCRTGGAGGGSVRVEGGHECILVNCTAANNTAGSHGAGLDLRSPSYFVNCTVVGNALYNLGDKSASGGIYHGSTKLKLLNTVVVHNYYMNSGNVGTTGNIFNKISSSDLLATASLADGSVADDEKELFAEYGTMDRIYQHYDTNPTEFVFAEPVPVPLLNNDEKRSRVVEIAKLGPLDGKGYLVKMTDDFSYVAYSKDRGATWTTFYGEESDGAKLLLHDQRGVQYSEKRVPIGAAAFDFPLSTIIMIN